MNVLHISDIHFRRQYEQGDNYKNILCTMQNPLLSLEICLLHMKKMKRTPDLIIITGDLTDDGEAEDYKMLRLFFQEKIPDIPIVVTMGNHDNKAGFRKGWLGCEPSREDYFADFSIQGIRVLSFDSAKQGNPNGRITQIQMKWLKDRLKEEQHQPVILVTHHHLIDDHEGIPAVSYPKEFAKMIRDSNIFCILCGHTHHMFSGFFEDQLYYTSDGMSFYGEDLEQGRVRFKEKFGYNFYQIEEKHVVHFSSETFFTGRTLGEFRWEA
ncbi:MAG: metallophosphoesterase [Lachnospiraceae bacterium]|nr:metallophosphoesterase [Lachnospiraceae bacterium]MDD3795327.1 metallophosphoesterase [Lachnospiraceae bacterium]